MSVEIIPTELIQRRSLPVDSYILFACPHHNISFMITTSGQVYSFQDENPRHIRIKGSIAQALATCNADSDICHVVLRTSKNSLYQWSHNANQSHITKRIKLSDENVEHIATDVAHILSYDTASIVLFSSDPNKLVQMYNTGTKKFENTSYFIPEDFNIILCQPVKNIDMSIVDFFKIRTDGLIYAVQTFVLWKSLDDSSNSTVLFKLNGITDEKIILLELICVPEISANLNTCLAIGDQGTIIIYSKDTSDTGDKSLIVKQFDVSGPLNAVIKIEDLTYIVSNGSTTSLLNFRLKNNDFDLHSTPLSNAAGIHQLASTNHDCFFFDALQVVEGQSMWNRIQYKPLPISIQNDQEAIKELIEASLKELEQSESSLRLMEQKEQELSQKLASVNQTLFALKSIQNKRKLGVINSLDTTGFEFTVRPILKSNSSENLCLQTAAYLRLCIKTSRFLELNHWELSIDLHSLSTNTGQSKLVSVIGFESHYDNGIEKSIVWERDIPIDLGSLVFPLQVTASLIMTLEEDTEIVRFPLCDMMMDDLHFIKPCNQDVQSSIERRGLDDVSNKLIKSYNLQVLHDRSRVNPLATLLQRYKPEVPALNMFLFRLKTIHLKYNVDPELSEEKYSSILGTLLCQGLSKEDSENILRNDAEHALFFLAAYPHSPVTIDLSRDSPSVINFCIQCTYPPALLKVEATLLQRINDLLLSATDQNATDKKDAGKAKKLQKLESTIIDLQDKYQDHHESSDMQLMDIDEGAVDASLTTQLVSAIELYYDIHTSEPLGRLNIP